MKTGDNKNWLQKKTSNIVERGDFFPHAFYFHLPNRRESFPSTAGFIFTVFFWVIMLIYVSISLLTLVQFGDSKVTNNTID